MNRWSCMFCVFAFKSNFQELERIEGGLILQATNLVLPCPSTPLCSFHCCLIQAYGCLTSISYSALFDSFLDHSLLQAPIVGFSTSSCGWSCPYWRWTSRLTWPRWCGRPWLVLSIFFYWPAMRVFLSVLHSQTLGEVLMASQPYFCYFVYTPSPTLSSIPFQCGHVANSVDMLMVEAMYWNSFGRMKVSRQ